MPFCCSRYILLLPLAMWLLLSACSDDKVNTGTGSGQISPEISVNPNVIPATDSSHPIVLSDAPKPDDIALTLLDDISNTSRTWPSKSAMDAAELFLPGDYTIMGHSGNARQEGFDKPFFFGSQTFQLKNGETARPQITCTLASTVIEIEYTESYRSLFEDYSVTLHSDGGIYVTCTANEQRPVYLIPGDISMTLFIKMKDGRSASFQPIIVTEAKPGYLYKATLNAIDGDTPQIVISFDDKVLTDDVTINLTDAFFNADAPAITPSGFIPGEPIRLSEGVAPENPVSMLVSSSDLQALILTSNAHSLASSGWPQEIDLLNMTKAQADTLKAYGLRWEGLRKGVNNEAVIDFTHVIPNLRYNAQTSTTTFTLQARNSTSKVSEPLTLAVEIEPVDLSVVSWTPAIVGINRAELRVKCPSSAIEQNVVLEVEGSNNTWTPLKIVEIEPVESSVYAIRFNVPAGNGQSLNIRVKYCGEVKQTITITRESPAFTIQVDPFALSSVVRIIPDDPKLTSVITSCASIYASGRKLLSLERHADDGEILVSGLAQGTRYSFQATVMANPTEGQFTPAVEVTTETCVQLPNSNFEDVKNTIDYRDLLSGGRYSQTVVGIFNLQNRTTYSLSTPKGWANVNDKTFCSGARNHNTWYMVPSTYTVTDCHDGAYAVRIDNVGWDIDGPAIPDYRQTAQPYTRYSLNVPQIAHRAAGRLFLGGYSFDPMTSTETYSEGIEIQSRPAAVNGFYKYIPSQNNASDRGIVAVEVLGMADGKETVIASGSQELATALSYTSFAVPLVYNMFGVKAMRIKVMFAASASYGSIDSESEDIITYSNPITSTSVGSSLWIDNLNLSY